MRNDKARVWVLDQGPGLEKLRTGGVRLSTFCFISLFPPGSLSLSSLEDWVTGEDVSRHRRIIVSAVPRLFADCSRSIPHATDPYIYESIETGICMLRSCKPVDKCMARVIARQPRSVLSVGRELRSLFRAAIIRMISGGDEGISTWFSLRLSGLYVGAGISWFPKHFFDYLN